MSEDRTVHASYPGMEIVRYDRAGKWYLEPTDKTLARQHVTIAHAAQSAFYGIMIYPAGEAVICFGKCGGSAFDSKVRALTPASPGYREMER